MSDMFHKNVPTSFVDSIFDAMEQANWHTFQVLTKRSTRLLEYVNRRYAKVALPSHIWLGVSVENGNQKSRIAHLHQVYAAVRFLSIEPLIGAMGTLDLSAINWVIVGGESGPGSRRMEPSWVREIRDQCRSAGVAFFFKQWGGVRPKSGGRKLDGREWNQLPIHSNPHGHVLLAAE